MLVECEIVLKVVKPVKALVYDNIRDYVGTIKKYDENLRALRKNLSEVCTKKNNIINKVNEGKGNREEITREADSWLRVVCTLTGDEKLKSLMYEDVETAKIVMRLMGKKDLKKLVRKDHEMQKLVVKVMNKLKEEMENSEDEDRLITTVDFKMVDYKMVAEVVVEVMKDTTEEFKKLMKKDKKMAVIATRMLIDTDLHKLTKDDMEMEDIVREAESVSDGDLCQPDADAGVEESSVLLVPGVDDNTVQEAVSKLLLPLGNLLPIVGELMNDTVFKNALPKAEDVKLGWDVINGLLLKNRAFKKALNENVMQHESCSCFCAFALSYYHNQYKMSIAAETIAKRIKNDMIETCQGFPLTARISPFDMKRTPTQFLKGLQSRDRLLQEILQILRDHQVDAVGVFGMGGCGKTTLAKEVACSCVDMFSIMVEISECPDIKRIQGTIAESIDLRLNDVQNIGQRATILYNRLISEKEKTFLIILDNIWEKLNLDDVGIPSTCKLLLTTREKEVCRLMGVRDANIREVGLLNGIESKGLFKNQVGDEGGREEFKAVTDRLLRKCGGLPLAIVVAANTLKDKDLPNWRKFADELERPISSQLATSDHRATYSILATSYRSMESEEKRMFFLLCCLCCFNLLISITEVMRYGIGLDIFQHVNKLSEAMDQADKWANELVSSSMLLNSDSPGVLKIHDVVRAFGISFAAKDDGHKLLVDAIPRWMNKKTLTKYTAISLHFCNDFSRLTGMESDELQILILSSKVMLDFPSFSFGRMVNLEVLDLTRMNFRPTLPEYIGKLDNLRTLYLEECKLGDIKVIGELVNLSVLSLRGSHLEELPDEIGKLCNLRMLNLSGCIFKSRPILPNILCRLSELEGLFMSDIRVNYLVSNEDGRTGYPPYVIEFNNLQYLNVLEMNIWSGEQLSVDAQFVKNMDRFRICVSYVKENYTYAPKVGPFLRILHVNEVDMGEISGKKTFKALLKKADWLRLSDTINFRDLFLDLDNEGLPELRHLEVDGCKDVNFFVNLKGKTDLLVFPSLRSLKLQNLPKLSGFCNGEAPPGIFSNLQHLSICYLKNLQYVLPFACAPCKLTEIMVDTCRSLKFIFIENVIAEKEETDVMELRFLKSLDLSSLDHLVSLSGSENLSGIGDSMHGNQALFNPRIILPSLEKLSLMWCKKIVKLWDKELGVSSFQSLRTITIAICEELSSVGPLHIVSTLMQLESLTIITCDSMHEVISDEGTQELETHDQVAIFPQLKDLVITNSRNLKSFYGGRFKLKLPKLKNLQLCNLFCLKNFSGSENQSFLFHEEMDFPCLEELTVSHVKDEVMGLWDWHMDGGSTHLSNPVPTLRKLTLCNIKGLRLIPSETYHILSSLEFTTFNDEVLLSSGKEMSVLTYSELPKLKDLCVGDNDCLTDLLRKEDFNAAAALTFCGQLKNLTLNNLPRLKIFPCHLFKSLCVLHLVELNWEYVIAADNLIQLQQSLRQLEALYIHYCKNMRVVIQYDGEGDADMVFEFPRLKLIQIYNSSVIGFSSTVNATLCLPSLEEIEVAKCGVIQHFWSGPIIVPKLKEVALKRCDTMQSFLAGNPSQFVELLSLQSVRLDCCSSMRFFSSRPVTAPRLCKIYIEDCSQIQWFLPDNPIDDDALDLPSLESIYIKGCPRMQSFSIGSLRTPNIHHVICDEKLNLVAGLEINLNHLLRSRLDIDFSEELHAIFCETM